MVIEKKKKKIECVFSQLYSWVIILYIIFGYQEAAINMQGLKKKKK